VVRFCWSKARQ